MDVHQNPYRPGAGLRPPFLAGREEQLWAASFVLERCELGFGERGRILTGLRGVGRTVLLDEFEAIASGRGWVTVRAKASRGKSMIQMLGWSLQAAAERGAQLSGGRSCGRGSTSGRTRRGGAGPEGVDRGSMDRGGIARGATDQGGIDRDVPGEVTQQLDGLVRALGARSRGVAVLVDDLDQAAPNEVAGLGSAIDAVSRRPLPVLLLGTGLPSLPEILARATIGVGQWPECAALGPLDVDAAHAALLDPALALDVDWTEEALAAADDFAAGHPYLLQVIGRRAWDRAAASPIAAEDVADVRAGAQLEADAGLYRGRRQRAAPQQRELMRALAAIAGDAEATTHDLAAAVGADLALVETSLGQLVRKGLLYSLEGRIAFSAPGMAGFVLRQAGLGA